MDSLTIIDPTLADSVQYWTAMAMKNQALFFESAGMWLDAYLPVAIGVGGITILLIYAICGIVFIVKKSKKQKATTNQDQNQSLN